MFYRWLCIAYLAGHAALQVKGQGVFYATVVNWSCSSDTNVSVTGFYVLQGNPFPAGTCHPVDMGHGAYYTFAFAYPAGAVPYAIQITSILGPNYEGPFYYTLGQKCPDASVYYPTNAPGTNGLGVPYEVKPLFVADKATGRPHLVGWYRKENPGAANWNLYQP